MKFIPTKLNRYKVYNGFNQLMGIGDEVTLPEFEPMADTVTGSAFLGEFSDPTVGAFGDMKLELPFNMLDEEALNMMDMLKVKTITIAGDAQGLDMDGNIVFQPCRVIIRGRGGSMKPGSFKNGSSSGTTVSITVLAIMIVIDGTIAVELDKINPTYKLWGVDQLAHFNVNC
ncbi:MAG: phage major tail tube protein [Faecalibacterium sp.]